MPETSALAALRAATTAGAAIELFAADKDHPTEIIKDATHATFGSNDQFYDLSTLTNFYNEGVQQPLKAVVFCWLHDKSSIVDYKNACVEHEVPDFKFLVKAELTTWLNGLSDTCQFVKEEAAEDKSTDAAGASGGKKHRLEDPQLDRIAAHERDSLDHNAALRGLKNVDFGYLVSDARKFVAQLKKKGPVRPESAANGSSAKKQPIIVISPATTALISLGNVKEFLENGRFVDPTASSTRAQGLVTVNHPSERLVPAAQQVMVVDNVDMFTKPEYWDRVVAVFTTGQTWQFAKYKYLKPEELFQRYVGFFVGYQGDIVPKQIKDWNVNEIKIDRERRFRDKMIVKDFWAEVDRVLVSRGYGK